MHCPSNSSNYWTIVFISHVNKIMFMLLLCLVTQVCPTLCHPMGCSPTCSSVHGIFQARLLEWVAIFLLQGNLLDPGIKPGSSTLQVDSLQAELPRKPQGYVQNPSNKASAVHVPRTSRFTSWV